MKKVFLTGLIVISSMMIFGQSNKVVSAFNYQRYGKLDLAKKDIDEASMNEKTMGSAKTWFYRGNIYYDIAMSVDSNFRKLCPDPLQVAYDSYMKAKQLDTKGEYSADILKYTTAVAEGFYNLGVLDYNDKDYKGSAQNFYQAFIVNQSLGRLDTTALYNAAVAAAIGQENQLAMQYYQQTIQLKYEKPDIYSSLSDLYKAQGDTAMAIQVVEQGRKIYPDDFNLLITEINLALATNDKDKAKADLELAMQIDKTNPSIFFAVGTIYDQLGNVTLAADAYQKAIDLNPDYFEANYNLGALYVNQAAEILTKANELPLDAIEEYNKQKALADDMLRKSLPYLEKAYQLMPEDTNTLVSLKEIYTRLGMTDKLKVVDEQLKNK